MLQLTSVLFSSSCLRDIQFSFFGDPSRVPTLFLYMLQFSLILRKRNESFRIQSTPPRMPAGSDSYQMIIQILWKMRREKQDCSVLHQISIRLNYLVYFVLVLFFIFHYDLKSIYNSSYSKAFNATHVVKWENGKVVKSEMSWKALF